MDETEEQNDDEQEKDDDDDSSMNSVSDTNFAEDDTSMADDAASKPIIRVDEPETKKLKGDESLEGDDGMKSEEIASFTNDLEHNRNNVGNDGSSDVTTSALNNEEKIAPLENGKSFNLAVSDLYKHFSAALPVYSSKDLNFKIQFIKWQQLDHQ